MLYGALNASIAGLTVLVSSHQTRMASQAPLLILDALGADVSQKLGDDTRYVAAIIWLVCAWLQIAGGFGMVQQQFRAWGLAASVLLMVPFYGSAAPCCVVFGLPLGVLSLVVVIRNRDSFHQHIPDRMSTTLVLLMGLAAALSILGVIAVWISMSMWLTAVG